MRARTTVPVLALAALLGCSDDGPTGGDGTTTLDFDLTAGAEGWAAGFADYPAGEEQKHGLAAEHTALPPPLDQSRRGFMLSGTNHSDDLFMFLKRRVTGLDPATDYAIEFHVEFATNAAAGCFGAGGAQGESVVIKAGAGPEEPTTVVDQGGDVRLSLDKGNQLEAGTQAIVLGNIANSSTDCMGAPYELKTLDSGTQEFVATTDAAGGLWLFVGSESGFEATTTLYYTRIRAHVSPR